MLVLVHIPPFRQSEVGPLLLQASQAIGGGGGNAVSECFVAQGEELTSFAPWPSKPVGTYAQELLLVVDRREGNALAI